MRRPASSTPSSRVPPRELRKAATVLAATVSMTSSRLPVRRLTRAEDLNSRVADSPRAATTAIGSSSGSRWSQVATKDVMMMTVTAVARAHTSRRGAHR